MDFLLDSEQEALRDAVRGLLAKAYDTSETRRAVTKQEPGWGDKTWQQLAEMGVLGLPFAEEDGGMGAGPAEVAIVAEEIGRVIAPEPFVELHPTLGYALAIEDGDVVWLQSRRGRAAARARLTDAIRPDTLFMPFHWGGAGAANLLTNPALDPASKMPEFKVCAVRVERA